MTRANENLNNPPSIGVNMTDPREGEDIQPSLFHMQTNMMFMYRWNANGTTTRVPFIYTTQSTGHTQTGSEKNEN
jgi:hypothetical protein